MIREKKHDVVFEDVMDVAPNGTPGFAFINTTGPTTKDPKVQRKIRAFVMRDHGKARRRRDKVAQEPTTKVSMPPAPKITIVVDASPEYYQSVQSVKAGHDLQCISGSCVARLCPCPPGLLWEETGPFGDQSSSFAERDRTHIPTISRFSAGRIDPFIKYPVEMTPRVRRLLDHG
jgi:hypothetical protein